MPDQRKLRFARKLRRAMTTAEARLWRALRASRFGGSKFKRQQPLGDFIVDFVCFESRLVVEVDGGQHFESSSDTRRDEWLRQRGFRVLRFWNNDVLQNFDAVLMTIAQAIDESRG